MKFGKIYQLGPDEPRRLDSKDTPLLNLLAQAGKNQKNVPHLTRKTFYELMVKSADRGGFEV